MAGYGFADESGDAGNRFRHGSSHYFVVAVVTCEDLIALNVSLIRLREQLRWSMHRELHWTSMSRKERCHALAAMNAESLQIRVGVMDKQMVQQPWRLLKPDPYAYLLAHTLPLATEAGGLDRVIIDGHHSRDYAQTLGTCVRQGAREHGRLLGKVTFERSHRNPALQVADMAAGAASAASA